MRGMKAKRLRRLARMAARHIRTEVENPGGGTRRYLAGYRRLYQDAKRKVV